MNVGANRSCSVHCNICVGNGRKARQLNGGAGNAWKANQGCKLSLLLRMILLHRHPRQGTPLQFLEWACHPSATRGSSVFQHIQPAAICWLLRICWLQRGRADAGLRQQRCKWEALDSERRQHTLHGNDVHSARTIRPPPARTAPAALCTTLEGAQTADAMVQARQPRLSEQAAG